MRAWILPALLVASRLFMVNTAALQANRLDAIQIRTTTDDPQSQTDFDEDTAGLSNEGACCVYTTDHDKSFSGITLTYTKMCGNLANESASTDKTMSTSCEELQPLSDTTIDPDGDAFTLGECICNIPILDQAVNIVILSLPAIAEIGCEIFTDALSSVAELGAAVIPGVDEMTAGMKAAVQAAKTMDDYGQDAGDFLS
jgi:hypothetical protein